MQAGQGTRCHLLQKEKFKRALTSYGFVRNERKLQVQSVHNLSSDSIMSPWRQPGFARSYLQSALSLQSFAFAMANCLAALAILSRGNSNWSATSLQWLHQALFGFCSFWILLRALQQRLRRRNMVWQKTRRARPSQRTATCQKPNFLSLWVSLYLQIVIVCSK